MSRRTPSSNRWRQRQDKDPYVDRAVREGWRSRAVFKLEEIDQREKLLRRGMMCVDLGSAPGAWSQYAAAKVGPSGRVLAVDLLPMDPIPGVEFLAGDFTAPDIGAQLRRALGGSADLVLSDMAPNFSGNSAIDLPRHIALADEALLFADENLKRGGDFLIKMFQGEGFDEFVHEVRAKFRKTRLIKPKASRAESREIYLLARQHGM
jgi:23S rRNA (uridine2552-2'-O)-methyltransferase